MQKSLCVCVCPTTTGEDDSKTGLWENDAEAPPSREVQRSSRERINITELSDHQRLHSGSSQHLLRVAHEPVLGLALYGLKRHELAPEGWEEVNVCQLGTSLGAA